MKIKASFAATESATYAENLEPAASTAVEAEEVAELCSLSKNVFIYICMPYFQLEKITFSDIFFFPLTDIWFYSVIIKLIFWRTMLSPKIVLRDMTDGCVQTMTVYCNKKVGVEELIPCI